MGNPLRKYPDAGTRGLPSIVYNEVPWQEIQYNMAKGWGYQNDFVVGRSSTTVYKDFLTTVINAGTIADAGLIGGVIALTPTGTENDAVECQGTEAFYIDAGYKLAFGVRFKVTDADEQDLVAGLCITDTTACAGTSDEVAFRLADGSANLLYSVTKDSGTAAADTGEDVEDVTFLTCEFLVDGEDKVEFYVDNELVTTVTSGLPNDEVLALTLGTQTGDGSANLMYIDWVYAAQWVK